MTQKNMLNGRPVSSFLIQNDGDPFDFTMDIDVHGQNLTNFKYYMTILEFPPATRASSGNLVRVDTPQ